MDVMGKAGDRVLSKAERDALQVKVEAFLVARGMSARRFGLLVGSNNKFITGLRIGFSVKVRTQEKIESFIRSFPPGVDIPWTARKNENTWSLEDDALLLRLWNEGWSLLEISQRMNRSKNWVVSKVRRSQLPPRLNFADLEADPVCAAVPVAQPKPMWTPEREEIVFQLYETQAKSKDILAQLNALPGKKLSPHDLNKKGFDLGLTRPIATPMVPLVVEPPPVPMPTRTRDGLPSIAAQMDALVIRAADRVPVGFAWALEWGERNGMKDLYPVRSPRDSFAAIQAVRAEFGLPLFRLVPTVGETMPQKLPGEQAQMAQARGMAR